MKIILGFGAVVIVTVVAFFSFHQSTTAPSISSTPSSFVIAVLHDGVSVKTAGSNDFKDISGSVSVAQASEIKTSATGLATLLYPNGTITSIDENSDIILETLSGQGEHSTINLVSGSIWSKIKNILGTGESYQVKTNNMVASVRGTIWGTRFVNNITTVFSIEHSVTVSARDAKGNSISGTDTIVVSGNKVIFSGHTQTGMFAMQPITDADLKDLKFQRALKLLIDSSSLIDPNTKLLVDRVAKLVLPSPTPTVSVKPSVSPTLKPTATPSSTPSPTATPTPTPNTDVTFNSVLPSSVSSGQDFTLNGSNFIIGRNTKQVSAVLLNTTNVQFTLIDAQTIFVTATQPSGTYDVSIATTAGKTLTLKGAITIK